MYLENQNKACVDGEQSWEGEMGEQLVMEGVALEAGPEGSTLHLLCSSRSVMEQNHNCRLVLP